MAARKRQGVSCLFVTERPSQTQLGSGGQKGREEFLPKKGFHGLTDVGGTRQPLT